MLPSISAKKSVFGFTAGSGGAVDIPKWRGGLAAHGLAAWWWGEGVRKCARGGSADPRAGSLVVGA